MRIPNWICQILLRDRNAKLRRRAKDRNAMIKLCREFISQRESHVVLDTETTGLTENDVVIEIAILDLNRNEILNTLIRPTKKKRLSAAVSEIHGIKMKDLQFAPCLDDVIDEIYEVFNTKIVITYNAEFDLNMLRQTMRQDDLREFVVEAKCLMRLYSIFRGEWSKYHNNYKRHKLPNASHSAIKDCQAAIDLIEQISETRLTEVPDKEFLLFGKKIN